MVGGGATGAAVAEGGAPVAGVGLGADELPLSGATPTVTVGCGCGVFALPLVRAAAMAVPPQQSTRKAATTPRTSGVLDFLGREGLTLQN